MHCAEKLYIVVVHHSGLDQHSSSMLSTVNARVDDHLWMGKPPRHMSTHPSLPSVAGWDEYLAKAVGVNRQIALYTSPYPCLAVCAFRCYTLLHNGTVLSVRHTASKVLPYNSTKQAFRWYTCHVACWHLVTGLFSSFCLLQPKNFMTWLLMAVVSVIYVKKTVVYTRVNGASHIENCKNYKKVITHQHIA